MDDNVLQKIAKRMKSGGKPVFTVKKCRLPLNSF